MDYNAILSNSTHNYMNDVYIKPWCRIAPYAIGLTLGYALYASYQQDHDPSLESPRPFRTINRYRRWGHVLAWTFALTILALCIFGTYGDYIGHSLTRSQRITFLALSRFGWAIAMSIIIFICFHGYGGKQFHH
jgi:hypothetical protein